MSNLCLWVESPSGHFQTECGDDWLAPADYLIGDRAAQICKFCGSTLEVQFCDEEI